MVQSVPNVTSPPPLSAARRPASLHAGTCPLASASNCEACRMTAMSPRPRPIRLTGLLLCLCEHMIKYESRSGASETRLLPQILVHVSKSSFFLGIDFLFQL